ncbi:MAG: response regulator transcription factor [Cytophagaceae bacterium]|jgi:DNA-binding response OmpR family regulator
MKILIIEDEEELVNSILPYLKAEGYICESVSRFKDALLKINIYDYDCFIIDLFLPDGSGFDLIRELKKTKEEAGILILSAKKTLEDKLQGLNLGADDYLTKPFHLSELNARLKSILRRRKAGGAREIVFNEIKILSESHEVYVNNEVINLTKKEYDLLLYFVYNKNKVVTKESIAEFLWGDYMDASDSFDFIYTHIKNLRKKLMGAGCPDYINNINRVGYKFKGE